jgi:uncharacterized protein (DUF1697 family)
MPKTLSTLHTKYVALLRAVNVGGKNKLPMKDLFEVCITAGCGNVQTYIQSGNVIFSAPPSNSSALSSSIAAQIKKRFGYQIPVVLRTRPQLQNIILNNPFLKAGAAENNLYVMFLANLPDRARVASLDPLRSPGDSFAVSGQEIFLHLPNGAGTSKLTNAWFDTKLGTIGTSRNWRTVLSLLDLMS